MRDVEEAQSASVWGFVFGGIAGFILGLFLHSIAPPAREFVHIPCAVPVYAVQASTLEDLQARAELKQALREHCAYLVLDAEESSISNTGDE
jgi:hypothetical protein